MRNVDSAQRKAEIAIVQEYKFICCFEWLKPDLEKISMLPSSLAYLAETWVKDKDAECGFYYCIIDKFAENKAILGIRIVRGKKTTI